MRKVFNLFVIVLQKFVCTSLRPTCLHYQELYNWDGCASFVADYITSSPLHPPDELVQEHTHRHTIGREGKFREKKIQQITILQTVPHTEFYGC